MTQTGEFGRSIRLAIVLGLLPSILLMIATGTARAAPPVQAGPNSGDSPCVLHVRQRAEPELLLVGETTRITFNLRAACPDEQPDRHVVLILDGSGSMAGTAGKMMKDLARELVNQLDPAGRPGTRVGVIELTESGARLRCPLTDDGGRTFGCIDQVGAQGESSVDAGITAGVTLLRKGRVLAGSSFLQEFIVVLSDGADRKDCAAAERAAQQARSQSMAMMAACLGPNCDPVCLAKVAKHPTYFQQSDDPAAMPGLAQRIHQRMVGLGLRAMAFVAFLAPDMVYQADSAVPAANVYGGGELIEWKMEALNQADELTLSFEVRAMKPGFRKITAFSMTEFRDWRDRSASLEFPPAWVSVFGPMLRSTPTP